MYVSVNKEITKKLRLGNLICKAPQRLENHIVGVSTHDNCFSTVFIYHYKSITLCDENSINTLVFTKFVLLLIGRNNFCKF